MVLGGTGIGLTSAPATQSIMAVVPRAKAGVGSAINDTTRLVGATLGVGRPRKCLCLSVLIRLTQRLPASLPPTLDRAADDSVGATIQIAKQADNTGHPILAAQIHQAASAAFFRGFSAGCLVAAGVSAIGAIAAFMLLPASGPASSSTTSRRHSKLPPPQNCKEIRNE